MLHALTSSRYRKRDLRHSALFIPPLLPMLVAEPPEGDEWEHEIKHDGYRTLILTRDGDGHAFTRNGHDWTRTYQPVVAASARLGARSAAIDGEMIVQDAEGRSDFSSLRNAIERAPHRLVFMAFDLLEIDGDDLRSRPLGSRRARLRDLVGPHDPNSPVQFSESLTGAGAEMLEVACGMDLEGIVSKDLNSRYRSGRQTTWLKTKCYDESDFVVVGAEHEVGKPAFALLAREVGTGLEYAGSAFLTLGGAERERFWSAIERLGRSRPPLAVNKRKGVRWVEPSLRVHVQHLRSRGKLRHATVREILP